MSSSGGAGRDLLDSWPTHPPAAGSVELDVRRPPLPTEPRHVSLVRLPGSRLPPAAPLRAAPEERAVHDRLTGRELSRAPGQLPGPKLPQELNPPMVGGLAQNGGWNHFRISRPRIPRAGGSRSPRRGRHRVYEKPPHTPQPFRDPSLHGLSLQLDRRLVGRRQAVDGRRRHLRRRRKAPRFQLRPHQYGGPLDHGHRSRGLDPHDDTGHLVRTEPIPHLQLVALRRELLRLDLRRDQDVLSPRLRGHRFHDPGHRDRAEQSRPGHGVLTRGRPSSHRHPAPPPPGGGGGGGGGGTAPPTSTALPTISGTTTQGAQLSLVHRQLERIADRLQLSVAPL